MELIKINTDHYIIVDDSEIKEGDWYYWEITKTIQIAKLDSLNRLPKNSDGSKKIIYSTQPLEDIQNFNHKPYKGWDKIGLIELTSVQRLINDIPIDIKAEVYCSNKWEYSKEENIESFKEGYNQCLEDNNEKKYTKEDLYRLMEILTNTESRMMFEVTTRIFIESLEKTEWEVEIIDGQLKLK